MEFRSARVGALALVAALFIMPLQTVARVVAHPPTVAYSLIGATVEDVSIETYGVVKPSVVWSYLSVRRGSTLDQASVDHDFANLARVGGFIPRLVVAEGDQVNTATLHWIVMSKWLKPTDHPFYADQPLSAPIQGIGYVITAPQMDARGSNFSTYTQFSRRANLARVLFTTPLHIDPDAGRESDLIVDTSGGRGVFRASEPVAINIYSWNTSTEALYWQHDATGNQFEAGVRATRSTTADSSGISAPSLYSTSKDPARNTVLEAALSHACVTPSTQWYPPYCSTQYRVEAFDAIGGLGATDEYQLFLADVARYVAVGRSTLALHANAAWTGGVVPDSFLVCGTARAYPKAFCGTDTQTVTAEYRLNDELPQPIKFSFFTETSANRVRGGTQPWALPTFQWHPDSGIGITYRSTLRLDLAYGQQGGRLSIALQGQTF